MKARLNLNGIMSVESAEQVDTYYVDVEEPAPVAPAAPAAPVEGEDAPIQTEEPPKPEIKKKKKIKKTQLKVEVTAP